MNDEVRKALDDMREWINQMVHMLTGLASRIEEIDDKLKTLEHIPVVWPYGVT